MAGLEFGERWARVIAVGSERSEINEHVKLRDGRGSLAKARGLRGDGFANFAEEAAFDFEDALVSVENFALIIF